MTNNIKEVMCFGEPLVGFFANKDCRDLPSFQMAIGGDTSNVALALTKLGHHTSYTTRLGNDFFAEKIKELWQKDRVDTTYVFEDEHHQTGVYFAIYYSQGDHHFIYKRKGSASANYTVEDAQKVPLEGLKVFHLSGISQVISQSCLEASFVFMKKCKQLNVLVSYDLNYRSLLCSKEYFKNIAFYTIKNLADLVSLNLSEAAVLGFNGKPERIVKKIREIGPKVVALKLGKNGCVIGSSEGIKYGKPFKIGSVVDTTGAGDSFTASVIVGILEQMGLDDMVRFTNAVASKVCTSIGSTTGQPTREEINNFLTKN
ncbi:MAG TPA: sugar kinase [Atribacterota bacterium]|nr:sugar kinase [Atribacterota bacterium]